MNCKMAMALYAVVHSSSHNVLCDSSHSSARGATNRKHELKHKRSYALDTTLTLGGALNALDQHTGCVAIRLSLLNSG
jgi:hypothetical protein